MRTEYTTLCGRDHTSFRSYYYPVKAIIDGDMCERFSSLDAARQKTISEELDRTPNEVTIRNFIFNVFIHLSNFIFEKKGLEETRRHSNEIRFLEVHHRVVVFIII